MLTYIVDTIKKEHTINNPRNGNIDDTILDEGKVKILQKENDAIIYISIYMYYIKNIFFFCLCVFFEGVMAS